MEYAFWSAQSVIAQQQALRSEAAALGLGLDAPTLRKLMHEQHQQQQKEKEKQQQQQQQHGGAGGSRGGEEEDGESGDAAAAAAVGASGRGTAGATGTASTTEDPRIRILDVDELLELFERKCTEAQAAAAADGAGGGGEGPAGTGGERRHMVGLVGYPNVGKSSTINALFGAKKTAVAPTPGKTKHFQTLHVSPEVGAQTVITPAKHSAFQQGVCQSRERRYLGR